MMKLLRIEMIKTLGYIPFRIILVLHLAFFIVLLFSLPGANFEVPFLSVLPLYQFPHVWNFLTFFSGYYNLTLVLLVIMMTCMEFNHKTYKHQVIFGLGRDELFIQKLILIFFLSLYVMLLLFISGLTSGIVYSYKLTMAIALERSWLVLNSFLQTFTFLSLGLFFASVFRNVILSVLIFGFYRVFLEPVIRVSVDKEYTWYFPTKFVTNLTPKPELFDIVTNQMKTTGSAAIADPSAYTNIIPEGVPFIQNLLLSLLFLAVLLALSWWMFRRRRLN
jgi:ABC-type transport system involved in multi-copper enzyme maturation permease subunit